MKNLNVIPLSALRAIEAIARNGTLALAADELGVTSGALSQRLAKAEELLERKLFNRSSGGLVPTQECAKVIPQLSRAMGELSAVVSELKSDDQSILTVTVAPIFASRWLIWRIHKFNQLHSDISVRIEPRVEVVDLDYSEVDIGIRVGSDPAMGIGAIKLLDQRVFPVCSPELAEKIENLEDLMKLPVIRENERLYGWNTWLSERGIENYELTDGPTYADASLCLDCCNDRAGSVYGLGNTGL